MGVLNDFDLTMLHEAQESYAGAVRILCFELKALLENIKETVAREKAFEYGAWSHAGLARNIWMDYQ